MQIQKLIITNEEQNEAVQQWIKTRGIDVKVTGISKNYSIGGRQEVALETNESNSPVDSPIKESESGE